MTSELREFLNEHRDLLEQDNLVELIQKANNYRDYYKELLDVLEESGAFEGFSDACQMFETRLTQKALTINTKYDVAGFIPAIRIGTDSFSYGVYTIEQLKKSRTSQFRLVATATGDVPMKLPPRWKYKIYVAPGVVRLALNNGTIDSAEYGEYFPSIDVNIMKVMDENAITEILNMYMKEYDEYCKKISDMYEKCKESFNFMTIARKYAQTISDELTIRVKDIFDLHSSIVRENNSWVVKTGLKNSRDDINVYIPFDTDPSSYDVTKEIKTCVEKLKRLKKSQERSAQKQAEQETQRPENYREITRRDITNAMKELDIEVSGIWYTNKHSKITTYKCAMCIVTPEECKRLEDKLRSIGADVESVTCSVGGSGWRQYPSLFIRIRN